MIQDVFLKNFAKQLRGKGKERETFVASGEIFPDEILVAVSLKNPKNLRMTTCYGSMDFPPPSLIPESGAPGAIAGSSASDAVQHAVNGCIDVIGGFFQSFFQEDRPVDYDNEYCDDWTAVDLDKTTRVYLRINRDNLELEAASDDFLERHEAMSDRERAGVDADDDGPMREEVTEEDLLSPIDNDSDEDDDGFDPDAEDADQFEGEQEDPPEEPTSTEEPKKRRPTKKKPVH
jgi:hypothetical protein